MGRSYTLARDMGQGFFKDIDILIFGLIHGFLLENHMIIHHYILKKKLFILQILVIPHLPPNTPKKDHFSLKRMIRST